MAKVKVEIDSDGVAQLLKSESIKEVVEAKANEVCRRAGSDGLEYKTDTIIGPHRAVARVYPGSIHAHYSNLKHNTLLKALT